MANFPPYMTNYNGAPNPNMYGYQPPAYSMPPQPPAFQPNGNPPMTPQPITQNRPNYICYPVGSYDEANASRVEAFDPPHIMIDSSHGYIYYKKFNQSTGGSDFEMFKWIPKNQQVSEKPAGPDYEALVQSFSSRLDGVDEKLENLLDILEKLKTPRSAASKGAVKE